MEVIKYKHHKFSLIALCCITCLMLPGCSWRKWGNLGYNEPYNFTSDKFLKRDYKTKAFRDEYDQARQSGDERTAKRERDEIIGELLLVIDTAHGRFERNLRGNKTAFDLATDFAQLGLTGAATITGGAATKSILAAIATGLKEQNCP